MTPDESVLLDRLADSHGTIRGAVLAGLRNLDSDRTAALEVQVSDLTNQLEQARERRTTDLTRTDIERSAVAAQLAESKQAMRAALAEAKELRANLREARTNVTRQRAARRTAEESASAARELWVHHAYCATCEKLVPESEWAEQPSRGGYATYHKRHGFREKPGLLTGSPSLLFWRGVPAHGEPR